MSLFICTFLLTVFVRVFSEKRQVQRNSLALLFENATADNPAKEVSLYINGVKDASLIVKWKIENGDITAKWRMPRYMKIFMDGNRDIRVANMDQAYEGKYYIQSSHRREVELIIDVEDMPSVTTRNKGIYMDTTLAAESMKHESEEMMQLLRMNNVMIMVILVIIVILVIVVIIAVAFMYHTHARRPRTTTNVNGEQAIPLLENSETWEQKFASLKWEEIMKLLSHEQSKGLHSYYGNLNGRQLWTKHFANSSWEDIKQLLSDDQQRGLQIYCDELKTWKKLFSDDQQLLLGPYADLVAYSY